MKRQKPPLTELERLVALRPEFFWSKVNRRGADECWEWTGAIDRGYARLMVGIKGFQYGIRGHRISYYLANGTTVPEGLTIDHLCRNTRCVNPRHIEAVTPRTNALRSNSLWAQNARKTHCRLGHEYTPDNTDVYITKNGVRKRWCSTCRRLKGKRRPRRAKISVDT